MYHKRILLIICGSIAAYKSLELIRCLRKDGCEIDVIITQAAKQFITPLSVSALTAKKTYDELFCLNDEIEMGHIALARNAEMILIVPASADFTAKVAHGFADDLASTVMLAANWQKQAIIFAPAMNPQMWLNPAVQTNIAILQNNGAKIIQPENGEAACGETGFGRLASLEKILTFCQLNDGVYEGLTEGESSQSEYSSDIPTKNNPPHNILSGKLSGKHFIVTAGGTQEKIDPVRFIGNYSSGKQGFAIAQSLHDAGAIVTLIYGATTAPPPKYLSAIQAMNADEMFACIEKSLPADAIICAAAIADWQLPNINQQKLKKNGAQKLQLELVPTIDILAHISRHKLRPKLVIGFAAETENMLENATQKLKRKGCDWLLANNVADGAIFGADETEITLITNENIQPMGAMTKRDFASQLTIKIAEFFADAP